MSNWCMSRMIMIVVGVCCLVILGQKTSFTSFESFSIRDQNFVLTDISQPASITKSISAEEIKIKSLNKITRALTARPFFPTTNLNELTSEIIIEGKLDSSRKYSVFSFTTDTRKRGDYMFYVPLTVQAWKRIGFDSIILAVGSSNNFHTDPLLQYIRSICTQFDAIFVYLNCPSANVVTISQIGRMFVANILSSKFSNIDYVYLLTSDVDLWPLDPDIYSLRSDMAILSLNSDCCGQFTHRGLSYKMLPMSNVGMRIMTWNKLTEYRSIQPRSTTDILLFLKTEFGAGALEPVVKGENKGWYLDQHTLSIMIRNWTEIYGNKHVMYVTRNTATDRIDRSRWKPNVTLSGKVDAHMPLPGSTPESWKQIIPLLESMYGFNTSEYKWSLTYYENYTKFAVK